MVLADDHALVRHSVRMLLDAEQGVEVVAEAGDLRSAMDHVRGHRPHVLVLDLGMPDGSSIEAIRLLRVEVPNTEIVVLTMEDAPSIAGQALAAGAIGFALKDYADVDLPGAVHAAARGVRYVSPRLAGRRRARR